MSELRERTVPSRYRYDWEYFADWCRANGHDPLPCGPMLVARFVEAENDVTRATARRRITAINVVHKRAGCPAPGTATAVRRLLSTRDHRGRRRRAAQIAVPKLPTRGWPAGLTGRRDALLLSLVCLGGVSVAKVGQLQRSDLSFVGGRVVIGGGHDVEMPVDPDDPFGILPVWARWAKLQAALDRARTPTGLILALDNAPFVSRAARPALRPPAPLTVDGALFPAFRAGMQWKAIDPRVGLTAVEAREVLRARLATALALIDIEDDEEEVGQDTFSDGTVPQASPPAAVLDADYYEIGMAKRSRANKDLEDLDSVYGSLEDGADELSARLEALLAMVEEGPG